MKEDKDIAGDNSSAPKPLNGLKTLHSPAAAQYYMENGYVVFTEAYHLHRGFCCKSGCRHCPYGFKRKQ